MGIRPFGMRDRIGYMFGDMANDFMFVFVSAYLMLFYTEVIGMSPAKAGLILLVARAWDAVADIIVGKFIDSSKPGRTGKFRPWIIRISFPLTVMGLLCFVSFPGMAIGGKIAWAWISYMAYGSLYSLMNIPYGSLGSVISTKSLDRTSLSTYRTAGAFIANALVTPIAPLLIFGPGKIAHAEGFFLMGLLLAILGNLCYVACYRLTQERISAPLPEDSPPDRAGTGMASARPSGFRALSRNRPFAGLVVASMLLLLMTLFQAGINPYLFKDYFRNPGMLALLPFFILPALLFSLLLSQGLVARYGKRAVCAMGMLISAAANFVMLVLPFLSVWEFVILQFVSTLGVGFMTVLVWAMVADVIDFHEIISGRREEGIVYAAYSFSRKLSQSLAGWFGSLALSLAGYVSGGHHIQSAATAHSIKIAATLVPAISSVLILVAIVFLYPLGKDSVAKVGRILERKRKGSLNREGSLGETVGIAVVSGT